MALTTRGEERSSRKPRVGLRELLGEPGTKAILICRNVLAGSSLSQRPAAWRGNDPTRLKTGDRAAGDVRRLHFRRRSAEPNAGQPQTETSVPETVDGHPTVLRSAIRSDMLPAAAAGRRLLAPFL